MADPLQRSRAARSAGAREPGPVALAALATATAAAALVVSRRGLFFTPDSWSYWVGSVSIAGGRGYRAFGAAQSVNPWPPLTSLYLSIWQALFGTTVETLRWALAAAAAATAVVWTRLAAALGARGAVGLGAAAALFAAFAAREDSWLLSEALALPLLGLALLELVRGGRHGDQVRIGRLALALAALLMARNAALVFLPALVVAAPLLAPPAARRAAGRTAIAAALALAAALAQAALLGQLASHPLVRAQLVERLGRRLGELGRGLAGREGDALAGFGWLFPLALAAALVLALAKLPSRSGRRALGALVVALVSSLLLVPLAAAVPVADALVGRFLWPVLLLGGAALAAVAGDDDAASRGARRFAAAALVALALVAVVRCADATRFGAIPFDRSPPTPATVLLPPAIRLDLRHPAGPPVEDGRWLVVAPPATARAPQAPASGGAQPPADGGRGGAAPAPPPPSSG